MTTKHDELNLIDVLSEIASCLNEIKLASPSEGVEFLTVKEASKYINVSDSLFRKWLFQNQIKPHRFGRCIRFNKKDLDKWIGSKII
jgi:excisionase family DNA binding protein